MWNRLVVLVVACVLFPSFFSSLFAQTTQQAVAQAAAATAASPHDLSGVWQINNGANPQGTFGSWSKEPPPMTSWAKERFDAAKPGYGPRAAPGGNDPILSCDPTGIPRILLQALPFEILQTPNRVFFYFEWQHLWREIWLNRRTHPKDTAGDMWMGDSVGWWEGNTFVVETTGFNDKSWVDMFGDPHSDEMRLTERYQRPDHNTLNVSLTIDDPMAYAQPWLSETKSYKLLPKSQQIQELFCVPEEEQAFTNRIRKPAAAH